MSIPIARADSLFRVLDANYDKKVDLRELPFLRAPASRDEIVGAMRAAGYRDDQIEKLNAGAAVALRQDEEAAPSTGKRVASFFKSLGFVLLGILIAPFQLLLAAFLAMLVPRLFVSTMSFAWGDAAQAMKVACHRYDFSQKQLAEFIQRGYTL